MPGVVIVRVEGGLFFANAEGVAASIRAHAADVGRPRRRPRRRVDLVRRLARLGAANDEARFAIARALRFLLDF